MAKKMNTQLAEIEDDKKKYKSSCKAVFSKNLSKCLKRSGKTQRELAAAIGIHPASICDWLQERTYPRMDKIPLVAAFFGISKSELVEDVYVVKKTVSEKEQRLLDLFYTVSEEQQDGLLEFIEVYVRNLR